MKNLYPARSKYLSVIVPVYNEEKNIPLLHERVQQVLTKQNFTFEILYIDDGSKDDTYNQLKRIGGKDEYVQIIRFRRNFGQTAAMAAGVAHCRGEIVVFMDGDLQNDPTDIPRLLEKINEGYDVVSGWRKNRQDAHISRKIPSMIANKLIARVTGVYLHDYGCTLKAYRYEVIQHIQLYGEMHRFIPAYASLAGANITEIPVKHHARQFGKSKYGISRTTRVILDLITFQFLSKYSTRPAHTFGKTGLYALGIGSATGLYALGRSLVPTKNPERRQPLLQISLLLSGFGLLSIMLGQFSELLARTYHEAQGKSPYIIRDIVSGQKNTAPALENPKLRKISNNRSPNADPTPIVGD